MKELSIKEKAKRYDKAIERAKAYKGLRSEMEIIFPELKESEDERIRKFISNELACLRATEITGSDRYEELTNAIAYLEKQVEQKPAEWHREDEQNLNVCLGYIQDEFLRRWLTDIIHVKYDKLADKVEPKFKVGDWITNCATNPAQISSIKDGMYFTHNDTIGGDIESINKEYHFWTIQDAKDGDVLSYRGGQWIFIFKKNEKEHKIAYHALTSDRGFSVNDVAFTIFEDAIDPATKEQRDLLFQKMKDAGYEWHAEKKELKKIEQKPAEWIDDDEKRMNHIIQFLEDKDRWKDGERAFPIEEDVRWLKSRFSLKQCNYNPYKATVESIAEMCEKYKLPTSNLSDFLDNVKVKCKEAKEYNTLFPHSTWKPSDEQMKALNDVTVTGYISYAEQGQELINLYNDLKKLREE